MEIRYACSYWGQEGVSPSLFLSRVFEAGFDGVEINFPPDEKFVTDFQSTLDALRSSHHDVVFIAQQVLEQANESIDEYLWRMKKRLAYLVALKPDFINSHTGKDYFSYDDNCRAIEVAESLALSSGVPIYHETHRGRFTFHAASLLTYLDRFPNLKLTGDFSHWCTVSESLLQDQEDALTRIIPHVRHIHARVGYEHSPQVNDPFAPEWKEHMDAFVSWWRQILITRAQSGDSVMTVTPEFGPVPYMPTIPYSQKPLADQWLTNVHMKNYLQQNLQV